MSNFNDTFENLVKEVADQLVECLIEVSEGVEVMWSEALERAQETAEAGKVRVKIPVTIEFCLEQSPVVAIVTAKAKKEWQGESLPEGHKRVGPAAMSNAERQRAWYDRNKGHRSEPKEPNGT